MWHGYIFKFTTTLGSVILREISANIIENAVTELFIKANSFLPSALENKILSSANIETNEIAKGIEIANKKGSVIMIGHVWSADFLPQILEELYPLLKQKGYVFTTVSKSGALIVP